MRPVGLVHLHLFRGYVHIYVGLDCDQFAAQSYVVFSLFEHGLLPRRKLGKMVIYSLDRAVFGNELAGADLADSLDTRHVVGRVAAYRQHVDDLGGGLDAVFAADLLYAYDLVLSASLSGLILPDVVLDELAVVLVRSDHIDIESLAGTALGHRPDHIVRFESHHHQRGDIHGLAELLQGLQGVDH